MITFNMNFAYHYFALEIQVDKNFWRIKLCDLYTTWFDKENASHRSLKDAK